jgi:steroid 5-alpha reductase family enzyme
MPDYYRNPRYLIAFGLVFLWGLRLTTNFAIKGGYRFSFKEGFSGEDYRWEILRSRIPNRLLFELFNLFFISFFQLGLIFLFTLPLYFYGKVDGPVSTAELCLYALHFILLAGELYSDILQFRFYKRRAVEPWSSQRRYRLGFNSFGTWKFSRHPNYLCEISQWAVVFLYLAVSTGKLHFSGAGALILIALFAGSTLFVESITSVKYPEYRNWKKITSVWIPFKSFMKLKEKEQFLSDKAQ